MKKIILFFLKFYKKYISIYFSGCCRFNPGCCEYFMQSVEEFGALVGCFYGVKRLLRCNPLFKGGNDPVKRRKRLN